jgi:SulP family sulfate permease
VITGFTSGIALIIAIGQIDNFLGISTPAKDRAAEKAIGYVTEPFPSIAWRAVVCAAIVVATMVVVRRVWNIPQIPTALIGISLATLASWGLDWNVAVIGEIPRTIVLDDRFVPDRDDLESIDGLLAPAFAIALLGAIESLLCGVVAGRRTKTKLAVNQELVAQGIGNIAIPFLGGVPATAAIARTSVGVDAGGATRLVSVVHSAALLLAMLFFAGAIGEVPLAALAGVLMVTAWRMNEWHAIRYYWRHRLKGAMLTFAATMLATVALDLTQAIIAGLILSLVLFLTQVSRLSVVASPVDWEKVRATGALLPRDLPDARVVYVTGALFFGATNQFVETIERLPPAKILILSMRGVPMVDVSSLQAIEHVWREQHERGGSIYLTGLQPQVRKLFERGGLIAAIGEEHVLWSADRAILRACGLDGSGPTREVEPVLPATAKAVAENVGFVVMALGVVRAGYCGFEAGTMFWHMRPTRASWCRLRNHRRGRPMCLPFSPANPVTVR